MLAPFQCDDCCYRNLFLKDVNRNSPGDQLMLDLIRRANLDMFWGRDTSTVENAYRQMCQLKKSAVNLGLCFSRDSMGPWPVDDVVGLETAILMLWKSLDKGAHGRDYCQFDTIRKIRTLRENIHSGSVSGLYDNYAFTDQRGRVYCMDRSFLHTKWFRLFNKGCESRMGNVTSQDAALPVEAMLGMLERLNVRYQCRSTSHEARRMAVMTAAALIIGFCAALRGGEIFLMEATEFCRRINSGRLDKVKHVLVPLMGRFKNEVGERNVLLPLVAITKSGIAVRKWLDRLDLILRQEGRDKGEPCPALCDARGVVLTTKAVEAEMHKLLIELQEMGIVAGDITVEKEFHLYRSLRRGATARATNVQLAKTVIDTNNRWRSMQTSRGKKNLPMSQLYLDIRIALPAHLAFSAAM